MRKLLINIEATWAMTSYKFRHWAFKWNVDEEGDLTFSIANILHFIKYKEHTIIKVGIQHYNRAPKHVGAKA